MSNNKQSSVEWLVEKLGKYNEEMVFLYQNEIEQARAMHKEEHAKTWDDAMENMKARGGNDMRAWADFDDYYNQTFGE